MRIERSVLPLFCAVAPVAAQFGLSLIPGFNSFTKAVNSIIDPRPSDPPARLPQPTHVANTPEPQTPVPQQTQQTPQAPSPTVVAPPITHSSAPPPVTTSLSSSHHSHPVVTSSSTPIAPNQNQHQNEQPIASPTSTASSSSGGGLSEGAKLGIGLTIGLLALCGLIGARIYSFVKDRRASQAWRDWRDHRRAKHRRLNSISSFRGVESEKDISDYGNGTLLNRPTQNLVDELPEPEQAVMQQARVIQIKRKAVPGLPTEVDDSTPAAIVGERAPPMQTPLQEPPRSYVAYSARSQPQTQHSMSQRMPPSLQVRNQQPPRTFQRTPRQPQMNHQPQMQRPGWGAPLRVRNPSPLQGEQEAARFSWVEDGR